MSCPNNGAVGVRVEFKPVLDGRGFIGCAQVEVFADAFDVVAFFEEHLVGVVVLEEVEEQVEAVLDHDAAFQCGSFAVYDFDQLVEDALEGDDFLEVRVRFG